MEILKDGYKSVSTEFKQLAGQVDKPLVTINRPQSIQQQMSEQFPLLAVEQKGGNTETETDITSSANDTSSSLNTSSTSDSTNSDSTNSDSTIRKISF
jgi:hypothetical protein